MRDDRATVSRPLAADLSATFAAIYRHCHPAYTISLGHQSVRALQRVSECEANVQSIARSLGCAPNTASELVQRLLKIGLVSKQRGSTGDERTVAVRLTPEGERAVREQTGLDIEKLTERLGALTEPERAAVQHGLQLLLACVSAP